MSFSRYRARPHDVPLVVFTATESLERFGSAALGWDKVHDGDVETVILSGDHFTIMSGPSVEKLARALSDRVSAAGAARNVEAPPTRDAIAIAVATAIAGSDAGRAPGAR